MPDSWDNANRISKLEGRVDLLEIQYRSLDKRMSRIEIVVMGNRFDLPLWAGILLLVAVVTVVLFGLGGTLWGLMS